MSPGLAEQKFVQRILEQTLKKPAADISEINGVALGESLAEKLTAAA